jgi:hypothetical protein
MTAYRPSRRIRLLKLWKRLWRETPDQMEKARLKATEAALSTYRTRNTKLAAYVQEWPEILTNPQLKERCLIRAVEFGFQPRSLKIKLKRLGLIAFDPARKLWVNRTKDSDC